MLGALAACGQAKADLPVLTQADKAALIALDKQIAARAEEKRIPSSGLELSAFRFDLLATLLDVRLWKAFVDEIPNRAKIRQISRDGMDHYCKGDEKEEKALEGVEEQQLIEHGYTKAELDNFNEQLLYKRNDDWIPKLEKCSSRTTCCGGRRRALAGAARRDRAVEGARLRDHANREVVTAAVPACAGLPR